MPAAGFGLGPRGLHAAFPFHLVIDHDTNIVQSGKAARRLVPELVSGGPLERYFRIRRPKASLEFDAIREHADSLFLLEARSSDGLVFKGQMLPLEEGTAVAFLCSPWLTDIARLHDFDLSLRDFAIHDPIADYLFLLQAQAASLSDTNRLTDELARLNKSLEGRVQERTRELAAANTELHALYQASQEIFATREPHRLAGVITRVTMNIMAADEVSLMLPDADDRLYVAHSHSLSPKVQAEVRLALWECIAGRVAASGEPALLAGELASDPRFADVPSVGRVRSSIVYPLLVGDRLVGVLNISRVANERPFRRQDIERASRLASHALLALENARLYREAQQEIGDRKLAQKKFRELLESAPDAIVIADTEHKIVLVNSQTEEMFGYGREELLGECIGTLVPELSPDARDFTELGSRLRLGRTSLELNGRRKDGGEFPVEISLSPLETDRGILITSVIRDITGNRELEDQVRHSQRMESVGLLAGGVAHDLNNKLMVIVGYTELGLDELGPTHPVRKDVEQIRLAAEQAAFLTRQLLAFSRKQVLQPKVLDVNDLLEKSTEVLQRLIGKDIAFDFVGESVGRVRVDPIQMEQVIMNLVVNARDAMPKGGTITIETANVQDEEYAHSRPDVQSADYVMLAVGDTGCGMNQETLSRIFDPFFTTKETDKGTGLGLSVVHGIVKQSGGHIRVYSEVDQGTTFRIYLPRVEDVGEEAEPKKVVPGVLGGSETILVVEDEDLVRELTTRVLEEKGYQVLVAPNGERALVSFEHESEIHLLLTDVVMPEMGGEKLVEYALRTRPDLKVIYMSGYTGLGVLEGGTAFLQKPVTPSALLRKVREVLDAPGVGA